MKGYCGGSHVEKMDGGAKKRGEMPRYGKITRFRLVGLHVVFLPGGFYGQFLESGLPGFCFPSHCSAHLKYAPFQPQLKAG